MDSIVPVYLQALSSEAQSRLLPPSLESLCCHCAQFTAQSERGHPSSVPETHPSQQPGQQHSRY